MFAFPGGRKPVVLGLRYVFSAASRFVVAAMFGAALCGGQVSVTTQRYNNSRSGLNLNEALLTPTNVNVASFARLFTQAVDGAILGHPLILPNVSIAGLGVHDVVYVGTMHDSVYAFDAGNNESGNAQPLWYRNFANPAAGITSVPIAHQACAGETSLTEIGIVPAMVIDAVTQTLNVVAKTEENGAFVHTLHALDVTTGQEKFGGPVQIKGSVTSGGVKFPFKDKFQPA